MDPEQLAALIESLSAMTPEERETAIAEIPTDQLAEVREALATTVLEFRDVLQSGQGSREDLDAQREARALLDATDLRIAALAADAEEMASEAVQLAEGLEPVVEEEEEEEAEAEADGDAEADGGDVETEEEEEAEAEAVTAAVPSPGALNRAGRRPTRARPAGPSRPLTALVAAGDAEGFRPGHAFVDRLEVAQSMIELARATQGTKAARRYVVARSETSHPITLTNDPMANFEELRKLSLQFQRDPELDPITAAGGFCAPETPLYGFFDIIDEDGLFTGPTVGAPRGQVSIPISPDFADITGNAEWDASTAADWTEEDDEAVDLEDEQTWKTCFFVPCGSSSSFKVAAAVTCLEYGNFANKFWPELIADTSGKTLKAHTHKVNARLIAAVVALGDVSAAIDLNEAGAIISLLHNLEFFAQRYRDAHRMDLDSRLDLLLPAWVRGALFADVVARDSTTTFDRVLSWFDASLSARGLSVQWLQDWQSIQVEGQFPLSVDAVIYAPGTVARLNEGTLNFGITRDTTSNRKNTFQQFMETFQGIAKVGHEVRVIDNIPIYPTGSTAERVDLTGVVS